MSSEIIKTKVTVNSSLIDSIVYDRSTKVMEVFYKRGAYKDKPLVFSNVEAEQYEAILASSSVGRVIERLRRERHKGRSWYGWVTSWFAK